MWTANQKTGRRKRNKTYFTMTNISMEYYPCGTEFLLAYVRVCFDFTGNLHDGF